MATITNQGISGLSLNDYLAALRDRTLAIDQNWNLEPDSPDGQKIGIDAELLANLDEAVVEAYNSKDPDKASGEALTDIGKIHGITRKAATYSIAPLTVSGTSGATLPAGSIIRSNVDDSLSWTVNNDIVVSSGGTGSGFVTSTASGAVLAEPGELTLIGTPTSGITSVTNPLAATPGQEEESDTAFRLRRATIVALQSSGQTESIYAAIAAISDVTELKVYENIEKTPDSNGIPANSIAVVVNGGTDEEIAEAMYTHRSPAGSMYGGATPVEFPYTSSITGNTATMRFQRAQALQVYISIQAKRIGTLPDGIADEIKAAILADADKTLLSGNVSLGFNQRGYDIGEVVPPGRLYTPVNKVLGKYGDSYVTSLTIGTSSGSLSATPIQPAYNQLPVFDPDNITVSVTS